MSRRRVVVVGASGLIGTAAVEEFARQDWDVVAIARRRPEVPDYPQVTHLPLDLTDPTQCARALADLGDVADVVYAASYEKASLVSGWSDSEQQATNLAMLQNVIDPLVRAGGMGHVTLMQGTKAYGVHLHPIPVPARESQPRDDHANFYWLHEDYMKEVSAQTGIPWTILRPVHVVGPAFGVTYSTPPIIGAFAAICQRTGRPFGFPGGPYQVVKQVVDVRIVAEACLWAATHEHAWGEHFNLTNGEVFTWRDIWPVLADALGLECHDIEPVSMGEFLPAHAQEWSDVVEEHGLRSLTIDQLVGRSHMYADYTFGYGATAQPPPALVSTIKVKQAGFTATMDTERTFREALETLVARRIIPTYA